MRLMPHNIHNNGKMIQAVCTRKANRKDRGTLSEDIFKQMCGTVQCLCRRKLCVNGKRIKAN